MSKEYDNRLQSVLYRCFLLEYCIDPSRIDPQNVRLLPAPVRLSSNSVVYKDSVLRYEAAVHNAATRDNQTGDEEHEIDNNLV